MQSFGIKGDLLGLLPGRQTFVIDKSGKCVMSFNDQMNAEAHVSEALKVIAKLCKPPSAAQSWRASLTLACPLLHLLSSTPLHHLALAGNCGSLHLLH